MDEERIIRLRAQLVDRQAVLVDQLAGRMDGGSLALLASVGGHWRRSISWAARRSGVAMAMGPRLMGRRLQQPPEC